MEAMKSEQHKKILASSWEQLSIQAILKAVALPTLIPIVVLSALHVWYVQSSEPFSTNWYSLVVFFLYIATFGTVGLYVFRTYQVTQPMMVVLMVVSGLLAGLIIAGLKLIMYFETWAVFRLISEPIFTAVFAGIFGTILLWSRSRLPSNLGRGIL